MRYLVVLQTIGFLLFGFFVINPINCLSQDNQPINSITVVYNGNIPRNSSPMILPNVNNVPGNVIVIVPPNYAFDRSKLNFPEIPPLTLDVKEIKLSYNLNSSNTSNSNYSDGFNESINSKFINGKVLFDIGEGIAIKAGCELTARISLNALKTWGLTNCFIPEPTNVTKIACVVGLALKNKAVNDVSKKGIVKGCTFIVKEVKPKVVEITVKMKKDAENYLEELKYWVSFLNTIEGAQWFMYRMQGNN